MHMKKIMISTLIGMTVLSGQVFAAAVPSPTPTQTQSQSQTLSLAQALLMATTNDPELTLMDEKIALAERELVQVNANAAYKRTETHYEYNKADYVSYRKSYLLTPIKKENSVASIKRQKDSKINSVKLDLMNQYYGIQTQLDTLSDAKRSLASLEKEIQAKSKELALGKITQLDFNNYEIKQLEMEFSVKKAEIDLATGYMKFASAANQPLSYKFTPVAPNTSVAPYENINLIDVLANERSKNDELLNKQAAIKEMETEIQINIDSLYEMGNTDSATNVLQDDLKAAQKDLANIEATIDLNLKLDNYKLQSSYNSILVSKASLALAQKEFDVAKAKYGVGTISLIDYLAKQEALDKADSSYSSSVSQYQIAVEKFKMGHFVK
jgi:outer membrane protein TolC